MFEGIKEGKDDAEFNKYGQKVYPGKEVALVDRGVWYFSKAASIQTTTRPRSVKHPNIYHENVQMK